MNSHPHPKLGNLMSTAALAGSFRRVVSAGASFLAAAWLLAAASTALADSPSAINYQGTLTDNVGKPLTSGVYQIQFKIWNDATSTAPASYIWGRSFPVHVATNGMFNVVIDNGGSLVDSPRTNYLQDAFADKERFLGLSIAATPSGNVSITNEISPRQKLVSAPFALHSSQADVAFVADRAYFAGTATNAYSANNATSFGNMTTNDFLWVKKANQGISGSLNITNNLTVHGTSTLTGTLNANGAILISNAAPIQIHTYKLPNIGGSNNNGVAITNTGYSTTLWSAAVIGWQCHANVKADNDGLFRFRATTNATGSWQIEFSIYHSGADVHEIYVDAMFIRKELVNDFR